MNACSKCGSYDCASVKTSSDICPPHDPANVFGASIEVERLNATLDWARARLETLLAIWDRPNWTDEMRRGVVRDVMQSLDREGNPKLRVKHSESGHYADGTPWVVSNEELSS